MSGFATELIHAGEDDTEVAAPLTTPVYVPRFGLALDGNGGKASESAQSRRHPSRRTTDASGELPA